MKIIDCEQGTDEWYKARLGLPTASNFSDIITTRGEVSKSRTSYLYHLAGEILSGTKEESYQSFAMSAGIVKEAQARVLLGMLEDIDIVQVGLCKSDDGRYGCSPDGLINPIGTGGCEIKSPQAHTHIEYYKAGVLPTKYFQQVQGSMAVTGMPWWYFMSYYPGVKPLIIKVTRDEKWISSLKYALDDFDRDLQQLILELSSN